MREIVFKYFGYLILQFPIEALSMENLLNLRALLVHKGISKVLIVEIVKLA